MLRTLQILALSAGFAIGASALGAAAVDRLEVRIITGSQGAPAGGYVELRLHEAGRAERRLSLAGDAPWPAGSTRTISVPLSEPLDPDAVTRFGIYYRAATGAPRSAWEIASADVFALSADRRERPLGATIRGVISREGEIASVEVGASSLACLTDADCDDGRACNGRERCDPRARNANARGCVAGSPLVCPTNQVCMEGRGCHGIDGFTPRAPTGEAVGASATATEATDAPATARSEATQVCDGRNVLLSQPGSPPRVVKCPAGSECVPQPNGTGTCAPVH